MATDDKHSAPPSYEDVMKSSGVQSQAGINRTGPHIGIVYPPDATISVGIHQPTPTAPPIHTYHSQVPSYGAFETTPVSVVVQQPIGITPDIVVIGGCPACRIGVLEDMYSCLGLLLAIAFFPIGILCCLALKTKRCTHCGTEF